MPAEPRHQTPGLLAWRGTTFGEAAFAAFALCALSGILLVPAFDPAAGRTSIATWLLTNPGTVWLRNVHYWTAQVFLVAAVLHAWDHLRIGSEVRVARGPWLRLVASVPIGALLLLSGFLLRGDSDAEQARRIVHAVTSELPLLGRSLALFVFGPDERLNTIYLHHAATGTILVTLVIIEHVRRSWPRALPTAWLAGTVTAVSLVLSPGLHDSLDPRVKGPWYFLGLQELLHWTSRPVLLIAAAVAAFVVFWRLPRMSCVQSRLTKRAAVVALFGYAALGFVGLVLRAENWRLAWNRPDGPGDFTPGLILKGPSLPLDGTPAALPVVLGRPEGCLVCHGAMTGLGNAHRPESVGCASCHGGNVFAAAAAQAHVGLVRVPGNLADADRTCGLAGCHESIVPRVRQSIMTTMAGVIEVDRRVFGERRPAAPAVASVSELGESPADSHVRQLCASCHLGQPKETWGAITQSSRGGGCNACHLTYDAVAADQLAAYRAAPARGSLPTVHPKLTLDVEDGHCFGCHSRSGRIATNYEGWNELRDAPTAAQLVADRRASEPVYRQLDDGRFFLRTTPDVHRQRGLACIDCHGAGDVMGRGGMVQHKRDQVRVRSEDCHAPVLRTSPAVASDPDAAKVLQLRGWSVEPGARVAMTGGGEVLTNGVVAADGTASLRAKVAKQTLPLRAPAGACTQGAGHSRLSCSSCHSAWAPRCASCHTRFDPRERGFDQVTQRETNGAWVEQAGAFAAVPPTLGVRLDAANGVHPAGVIDTFVPGMIAEIDRNRAAGHAADPVFRRLYARVEAHTTRRQARTCESCHNDPVALGYGEGALVYRVFGRTGQWEFTPRHAAAPQDGLPADAWIPFLGPRTGMVSTREDVRPFTVEEQRRILRVGACLTCHPGDSAVLRDALADFDATLARRNAACATPVWR